MAEPERKLGSRFYVGDWLVDGDALAVTRGGDENPLEPRAFAVLRYLAERPGRLVSIDELMDALWRGAVVTPNAVTRVIAQLRKALEDDARQPEYIETVARTGYRLIASVESGTRREKPALSRPAVAPTLVAIAAVALLGVLAFLFLRPAAEPSVAVLPFENLTGDPALDYLADGVAEELLNGLATLRTLDVSARSRTFSFRGTELDPLAAADELGVRFVATGSIRRSGPTLRISARILDARRDRQIWSDTVEVTRDEIFSGQQRIAGAVATALAEQLDMDMPVDDGRLAGGYVPESAAYDLYLRGRHVWHRRGSMDLQPAIDAFAEAVRIDPDFAKAWAALASAYLTYPSYSPKGYSTWWLAEDAARKALSLDPALAEPYAVLGTFSQTRLEWKLANSQYRAAVERGPDSPILAHWYGEHLSKTARYTEANEEFDRSIELDPTYLPVRVDAGFGLLTLGAYEDGLAMMRSAWDRGFRNADGWVGIFIALILTGDLQEVREWLGWNGIDEAERTLLERFVSVESGAGADAALAADITARETRFHHAFKIWLASRLGESGRSIEILDDRLENGWLVEPRVLWAPGVSLRQHERFPEIVAALGLLDYWESVAWGDICWPEERRLTCAGPQHFVSVTEN